jgi:hypothetical protein
VAPAEVASCGFAYNPPCPQTGNDARAFSFIEPNLEFSYTVMPVAIIQVRFAYESMPLSLGRCSVEKQPRWAFPLLEMIFEQGREVCVTCLFNSRSEGPKTLRVGRNCDRPMLISFAMLRPRMQGEMKRRRVNRQQACERRAIRWNAPSP